MKSIAKAVLFVLFWGSVVGVLLPWVIGAIGAVIWLVVFGAVVAALIYAFIRWRS